MSKLAWLISRAEHKQHKRQSSVCIRCTRRLGKKVFFIQTKKEAGADITYCPFCGEILSGFMNVEYECRKLLNILGDKK